MEPPVMGGGESDAAYKEKERKEQPIVLTPPPVPGQGPKCIWDGAPTQRTGMCWTCVVCGSTSSC